MPSYLGREFEIDWRGRPPHMLDQDIPVWYRFLKVNGYLFQKLYYDVYVGGPFFSSEKLKDPLFFSWRALNAKRIDALAETEKELWLIEVNTDPGLRAVGQLMVYLELWKEDPLIAKPIQLVLVCAVVDPDLLASAARLKIKTFVMPGSSDQTLPI